MTANRDESVSSHADEQRISEQDFHIMVAEQYSFSPHTMVQEELERKSPEIDAFWKKVTSNQETMLPLLRKELNKINNPPFFYYDGSQLLLTLSNDKVDGDLAVSAIARTDLRDIQPDVFLYAINKLGRNGFDTTAAAFRVLDYPDFKVVIPAHALTLAQNYALIFMLSPVDGETVARGAIKQLGLRHDVTSRKTLLQLLWYTVTKAGDETLARVAMNKTEDAAIREYAQGLVSKTQEIEALSSAEISILKQKYSMELSLKKKMRAMGDIKMPSDPSKVTKEQIEFIKLFLRSMMAMDPERAKRQLTDLQNNSDGTVPKEISEFAKDLLTNKKAITEGFVKLPDDIEELRKMRRSELTRLSDEALESYDMITVFIRWAEAHN